MRARRAWAFGRLALFASFAPFAVLGCTGASDGPPSAVAAGAGGSVAGSGGAAVTAPGGSWQPLGACEPVLEQRVTRLSDRHIANGLAELLDVPAPAIETGALSEAAFIPGKAATVNGAVASKLQDVAETAATLATATGRPLASCVGSEPDCAKAFIDDFASRAFRRPLREQERTDLLAAYDVGRQTDGTYAGGISLVIETVLQSPSFLYLAELGTAAATGGEFKLSGYETAAKLAIFLRDGLPDAALWQAAKASALDSDAGVTAEVDRLLADPLVQRNLSNMFGRFFQLNLIPELERPTPEWPALADAMHDEAVTLVSSVLWQKTGTLSELLTTRDAVVTPELATLYGLVPGPGPVTVALPQAERAGILTRAGLMAARAETESTSVVHRGLQVARGLLCVETPPPPAAITAQIEASKAEALTERQRAERRSQTSPCNGCHAMFDPFGVTFEHYDPVGKYRDSIPMPDGDVPVEASQDIRIADVVGHFDDAVQLSEALAKSPAARECLSRQLASYAVGEKLTYEQACTVATLAQRFEASGGNMKSLIKDVALWPALRTRKASTQ